MYGTYKCSLPDGSRTEVSAVKGSAPVAHHVSTDHHHTPVTAAGNQQPPYLLTSLSNFRIWSDAGELNRSPASVRAPSLALDTARYARTDQPLPLVSDLQVQGAVLGTCLTDLETEEPGHWIMGQMPLTYRMVLLKSPHNSNSVYIK